MAQKLYQTTKKKVAAKKSAAVKSQQIALVGTYKEKQLAWIKRNGVYNYPVKDGDEFDAESFAKIKELWLYADAKARRHCFTAEFVGKMTREEFLASYPTYANLGRGRSPSAPNGRAASMKPPCARNSKLSVLAKSENREYYVFKTSLLDYGPQLNDPQVLIRAMDFATGRGRARLVKKAFDQYKADGEFAPLAAYLPTELSQVPLERLRVCEAAVQMDFFIELGDEVKPDVPFPSIENPKFTFIDLFAGIGGFRLAMQAYGGQCVFSSEWDGAAQKTYCANYGDTPYGDITKQEVKDLIPDHFDVLCAGFPCQPFSLAGVSARNALNQLSGFQHPTQGTLFFDIVQIVHEHKPKVLFLENVRNLMAHDEGRTFKVIKDSIEAEGYSFNPMIIDASPLVPQKRLRCYMVCVRDKGKFTFPKIQGPAKKLKMILEPNPSPSYTISDGLWAGHQRRTHRNLARGTGFTAFTADIEKPAHTLVARYYKDGKECLIPQKGKNPRLLTPRECARLQGFPENFVLPQSRSAAYKQMGNSVAVPVLTRIAECIYNQILKGS